MKFDWPKIGSKLKISGKIREFFLNKVATLLKILKDSFFKDF